MNDLEGETAAHAHARGVRRVQRGLIELLLSLAFLALVLFADRAAEAAGVALASVAATVAAAGVIAAWFVIYLGWHRAQDEFERTLELQSVALAAGVTIVGATTWGLFEIIFGVPGVPIVFLAPAFSTVYAVVRMLISRRYR